MCQLILDIRNERKKYTVYTPALNTSMIYEVCGSLTGWKISEMCESLTWWPRSGLSPMPGVATTLIAISALHFFTHSCHPENVTNDEQTIVIEGVIAMLVLAQLTLPSHCQGCFKTCPQPL